MDEREEETGDREGAIGEDERRELLERIARQSATIGSELPETITVGDDELPIEEFLIETWNVEGIPAEAKPAVREANRRLVAERERLVERLESEPLGREEATAVAETIVGIDRATNALRSLRGEGFAAATNSSTIDDHKRWLSFLDAVRR